MLQILVALAVGHASKVRLARLRCGVDGLLQRFPICASAPCSITQQHTAVAEARVYPCCGSSQRLQSVAEASMSFINILMIGCIGEGKTSCT